MSIRSTRSSGKETNGYIPKKSVLIMRVFLARHRVVMRILVSPKLASLASRIESMKVLVQFNANELAVHAGNGALMDKSVEGL